MGESRAEFKARLMAEGKWSEFVTRREGLKRAGLSPAEAAEAAASEPAFRLPVDPADEAAAAADAEQEAAQERTLRNLARQAAGQAATIEEVMRWTFENALSDLSDPEAIHDLSPPSSGAVGLLRWVQSSPAAYAKFLELWSKIVSRQNEDNSLEHDQQDLASQLRMLAEFERQHFGPEPAPAPAGAQEPSAEPGLPGGDPEAGGG